MQTTSALPPETSQGDQSPHTGLQWRGESSQGLIVVGVYKLTKVVFFCAVGFGALHLIHKNLGDEVMHVTEMLRLGPESHVVSYAMDKADLIGHHQLREASIFAFGYAGLCLVEGTGLLLRKVWAEYFTAFLTLMGLPLESYELLQRFNWFKMGALIVNLLVLLYLLVVLHRKRELVQRHRPQAVSLSD